MKDFRICMKPNDRMGGGSLSASLHVPCKNGIVLSIQAGEFVYSDPRRDMETGENPTIYKAFEIALFDSEGGMMRPNVEGNMFSDRPWASSWTGESVAGWVDGHVIDMIIKDIGDPSNEPEPVDWESVWTDQKYGQELDEWQKSDGYE